MFNRFLKENDFSCYDFSSDLFPTVDNREFWESFQNKTYVREAEKELDYNWPIIKATDFMEFKKKRKSQDHGGYTF